MAKVPISLAIVWETYELAWRDDREITWEDAPEISQGATALIFLWGPELLTLAGVSSTPLLVGVYVPVAAGAVVSAAIGGAEGLENYIDFMTETPEMVWDLAHLRVPEKIKFTAETIYEHKIKEPLAAGAEWYVDKVDSGIDLAENIVDQGFDLLSYGQWANPTPGWQLF